MCHVYDHPVQYMKQDPPHMSILILSTDDMTILFLQLDNLLTASLTLLLQSNIHSLSSLHLEALNPQTALLQAVLEKEC